MVVVNILPINLPTGFTHESTSILIAKDKLFKDIIAETNEDSEFKLVKEFEIELEVGETYYVKSKVVYNKGFSKWSKIEEVVAKDITDVTLRYDIPGAVKRPDISHNYILNRFPVKNFTINIDEFQNNGTGVLDYALWSINDIDGKSIYYSGVDRINVKSKTFDNIILPNDKVIRIEVQLVSTTGDVSAKGTLTAITASKDDLDPMFISNLKDVLPNNILTVEINRVVGLTKCEWKLKDDTGEIIYSTDTTTEIVELPAIHFTPGRSLTIEVQSFILADKSNIVSGIITVSN